MKKLAIVSTHPIQYYAPVFKLLAKRLPLKVFYTGGVELVNQYDQGFKKKITWDIDLMDGYDYDFLENTAKIPGSHHYSGIVNPSGIDQISNFKPDAILIYGWSYKSHLKIIRYFSGKLPIYFRGDSTLLDEKFSVKQVLKKILLSWIYKHVDFAFYVGSANKDYFKKYGMQEHQLIFAPHAIDNDRFKEDKSTEKLALRKKLNINEEEILLVFAGKLEAKKNPMLLLEVFLALRLPHVHLLFVGNGELENELKDISHRLSTTKKVHFMDFQNQTQMPVIYQSCDLFCLPSKGPGETWGLAINEAMASGRAILVSDKVGCAQDLITDQTGRIFKSDERADLIQKLIDLTLNKSTLQELGKNASEEIQKWNFENQVNSIANHVNR